MMDLEKAGITAKGIAEVLEALVDAPFTNAEALLASARVLNGLADELTVASNEP